MVEMRFYDWYTIAIKIQNKKSIMQLFDDFHCHPGEANKMGEITTVIFESEEYYNWFMLHQ
jgi:hypothetical protein